MSTGLGEQSYSSNPKDVKIWRAMHNDGHHPLNGVQNVLITKDSGSQFTIEANTKFSIYNTGTFDTDASPSTQNNSYGNSESSISYLASYVVWQPTQAVIIPGTTSGFSGSDATYYVYCDASNDVDTANRGLGVYAGETDAPSWDEQKAGYYHATHGKALAKYVISGSSITDFEVFQNEMFLHGNVAPTMAPGRLGMRYLDTVANRQYISTGTSSSSDWDKVAVFASGTETVTGGGGDVTVNLPWSWEDGFLTVHISDASGDYFDTGTADANMIYETTYLALTSGTYTDGQVLRVRRNDAANPENLEMAKTTNRAALPKSATTTSFTLDDDGATTVYVKWYVWA